MERQINFPRFSFAFAFVIVMLGTHEPRQQATLTNKNKIPEIFFRFRNSTKRKSKILGFYFFSLVIVSVRMVQWSMQKELPPTQSPSLRCPSWGRPQRDLLWVRSKVHSFWGDIVSLQHAPKKSSASKMEGFPRHSRELPQIVGGQHIGSMHVKDPTLRKSTALLFPVTSQAQMAKARANLWR